jgi:GntR family transcriptional regulator
MVYCVDTVDSALEGPMMDYKYLTITETLRERIAAGEYEDGKLPSTKELRDEFDASYGSVRSAILILKAQGVVVGRQGQGVFVNE